MNTPSNSERFQKRPPRPDRAERSRPPSGAQHTHSSGRREADGGRATSTSRLYDELFGTPALQPTSTAVQAREDERWRAFTEAHELATAYPDLLEDILAGLLAAHLATFSRKTGDAQVSR